jgi:hypothetical protein
MPRVAKRVASLLLPRPILAAGIGKPQAYLAVRFSISASRRGVMNVGSSQATTSLPACWQMVVPPRECHRAGSADRRARFLGHHCWRWRAAHPAARVACSFLGVELVGHVVA